MQFNAPSISTRCSTYPTFPDASCTGVPPEVTLTNIKNGDYGGSFDSYDSFIITTPDVVVDAKLIPGDLWIRANNITLKNSKAMSVVDIDFGVFSGFVAQDTEFDGTNLLRSDVAAMASGGTCGDYGPIDGWLRSSTNIGQNNRFDKPVNYNGTVLTVIPEP